MDTNLGKVGIIHRGVWSAAVSNYEYLDTVTNLGSSYMVVFKNGFVPAGTALTNTTYYTPLSLAGPQGDKGWQPVFANVPDGARIVQQLKDYTGGSGTKPTENINSYVTATGFSTVIANAVDIRGVAGTAGVSRIPSWVAQAYSLGMAVAYLGKYWISSGAALSTDVPGTSAVWVDDLLSKANVSDLSKYVPSELFKPVLDGLDVVQTITTSGTATTAVTGQNWVDANIFIPANKRTKYIYLKAGTASNGFIQLFSKVGNSFTLLDKIPISTVVGDNTYTINKVYTSDVYIGFSPTISLYEQPVTGYTAFALGNSILAIGDSPSITTTQTFKLFFTATYVSSSKIDDLTLMQKDLYAGYKESLTPIIPFDWLSGTYAVYSGYASFIMNGVPIDKPKSIYQFIFQSTSPIIDEITQVKICEIVAGVVTVVSLVDVSPSIRSYSGNIVTQTLERPIVVNQGQYLAFKGVAIAYTSDSSLQTQFNCYYNTAGDVFSSTSTLKGAFVNMVSKDWVGVKDIAKKSSDTLTSIAKNLGRSTKFYEYNFSQPTTEWTLNAWVLSNGLATSTTAGSKLILNRQYTSDRRLFRQSIFPQADSILKVGTVNANFVYDTSCVIDIPNLIINLNRRATTTIIGTTAITFAITPGLEYWVELERRATLTIVRLIDPRSLAMVEVRFDYLNGLNYDLGAGNHRPFYCMELVSGTSISVGQCSIYGPFRPYIAFTGDSITEDNGRCYKNWAVQLMDYYNNDACNVSMAGQTVAGCITALNNEIAFIKPRILSVKIGINGIGTVAQYQSIVDFCATNGVELILNHVTCVTNDLHIAVNSRIDTFGKQGAKFDLCTALQNFPTIDSTHPAPRLNAILFNDGTHPNQAGNSEMVRRFKYDLNIMHRFGL